MRGRGKKHGSANNLLRPRAARNKRNAISSLAVERLTQMINDNQLSDFYKLLADSIAAEKMGGLATIATLSSESYRRAIVEVVSSFTIQDMIGEKNLSQRYLLRETYKSYYNQAEVKIWNQQMLYQLKAKKPLTETLWWAAFLTQFEVDASYSQLPDALMHKVDGAGNVIIQQSLDFSWPESDEKMSGLVIERIVKQPGLIKNYNTQTLFHQVASRVGQKDLAILTNNEKQKVGVLKALTNLRQSTSCDLYELKLNDLGREIINHPKFSSNAAGSWLEDLHYLGGRRDSAGVMLALCEMSRHPRLFEQKKNIYHATESLIAAAKKMHQHANNNLYNDDEHLSTPAARQELVLDTIKSLSNLPQFSDRFVSRFANQATVLLPDNPLAIIKYLQDHPLTANERKIKLAALARKIAKK